MGSASHRLQPHRWRAWGQSSVTPQPRTALEQACGGLRTWCTPFLHPQRPPGEGSWAQRPVQPAATGVWGWQLQARLSHLCGNSRLATTSTGLLPGLLPYSLDQWRWDSVGPYITDGETEAETTHPAHGPRKGNGTLALHPGRLALGGHLKLTWRRHQDQASRGRQLLVAGAGQ